jgi:hypothetical protein
VIDLLVKALVLLFAAGMIGCVFVLLLTFIEDLHTIFDHDEPVQQSGSQDHPKMSGIPTVANR